MDQLLYGFNQIGELIRRSGFVGWAVAILSYFIPVVVAWSRQHKNTVPIFIINFFLGWTFVGWVVALAWSLTSQADDKKVTRS